MAVVSRNQRQRGQASVGRNVLRRSQCVIQSIDQNSKTHAGDQRKKKGNQHPAPSSWTNRLGWHYRGRSNKYLVRLIEGVNLPLFLARKQHVVKLPAGLNLLIQTGQGYLVLRLTVGRPPLLVVR